MKQTKFFQAVQIRTPINKMRAYKQGSMLGYDVGDNLQMEKRLPVLHTAGVSEHLPVCWMLTKNMHDNACFLIFIICD